MAGRAATPWFFRCGDVVFPLREGTSVIGRGSQVEVSVDDDLVSRRHAELEVTSTGVRVRDLGSRNGVYLRDRKLSQGEVGELSNGDRVIVGRTTLVLMKERERGRMATVEAMVQERLIPPPVAAGSTGIGLPYESFLAEAGRAAKQGDLVRLETVIHVAIQMVTNALRKGLAHDAPVIDKVVGHALTLAEKRGKGWIERVFVLYEAGPIVISVDVLTTIERLAQSVGLASRAPLESYIETIRPTLEGDARGRALLTELLRIVSR